MLPYKDHLAEQLEQAGVRCHCLSTKRSDQRWPFRLRRLIADGEFDIVHSHSPLPAVGRHGSPPSRCRGDSARSW